MKNELSAPEFFCVENMLAMSLEMLHELNRNTMQYIIDEQKKELEEMDKELGEVVTRNYPEMKRKSVYAAILSYTPLPK